MKILQTTIWSFLLFGAMTDCTINTEKEKTNNQGKEYTSEYVCPMHCEGSGSDTAGTCPVCEMDYVKNNEN